MLKYFYFILFGVLIYSNSKSSERLQSTKSDGYSNINKSNDEFIQVIPFTGIILFGDTLKLKSKLKDLYNIYDTSALKYNIEHQEPATMVITCADSPPLGSEDEYLHQEDKYQSVFTSYVYIDGISLKYNFKVNDVFVPENKEIIDSLELCNITIYRSMAGINKELMIGDSADYIFKYYPEPRYCSGNNLRYSYKYNGVVFYIDKDMHSATYKTINKIEIFK